MAEPSAGLSLALNPALDLQALAARFAIAKRLQIGDFLTQESAGALRDELVTRLGWRRVISGGSTVFEIDAADFQAMSPVQRQPIDAAIEAEAAHGFRFRYEVARVPDSPAHRETMASYLATFAKLMSSENVLNALRTITGMEPLAFADAQATLYRAGDFLTRHDDDVAGKHRKLAYVLGLTADWQPEWGGLLLFNDDCGGVAEAIVPRFNALSLFAVPQPHSVGCVAPYTPVPRVSITGWIRSELPGP